MLNRIALAAIVTTLMFGQPSTSSAEPKPGSKLAVDYLCDTIDGTSQEAFFPIDTRLKATPYRFAKWYDGALASGAAIFAPRRAENYKVLDYIPVKQIAGDDKDELDENRIAEMLTRSGAGLVFTDNYSPGDLVVVELPEMEVAFDSENSSYVFQKDIKRVLERLEKNAIKKVGEGVELNFSGIVSDKLSSQTAKTISSIQNQPGEIHTKTISTFSEGYEIGCPHYAEKESPFD